MTFIVGFLGFLWVEQEKKGPLLFPGDPLIRGKKRRKSSREEDKTIQ